MRSAGADSRDGSVVRGHGRAMHAPDDLSEYYAELLEGSYECVDRIVLNAYYRLGQMGGGVRLWWRRLHGGSDAHLTTRGLREMAGDFARRVRAYCAKQQIVFLETEAGERKHELAEEYLRTTRRKRGLFLVICAKAPAPLWEVHRHKEGGHITDIRHGARWQHVKHYYFHLLDPQWGHVTVRMCGHPPFGAQVILNGHERVERGAQRRGVALAKAGNCFVAGADFARVERLAAAVRGPATMTELAALCERWLYSTCLCFALTREEQRCCAFKYDYSLFQLELSRNLLFRQAAQLETVYQRLVDRTRASLDIATLKTIFGARHRPQQKSKRGRLAPEVVKSVRRTPDYDLTVLKVQWGALSLKLYDKGERVLRAEIVVHNTKALRCGKVLAKWPELLARMQTMLVRFLSMVQAAHVAFIDAPRFEAWSEPSQRGQRRLAGLDLNKARNRQVVHAAMALATKPDGFTSAELAQAVRAHAGWSVERYHRRHAAYDLAKLRGKDLARPIAHSRRHAIDPTALRALSAYVILREEVIAPVLAGVDHPAAAPPRRLHPIDERYVCLRTEMLATLHTLGIAA